MSDAQPLYTSSGAFSDGVADSACPSGALVRRSSLALGSETKCMVWTITRIAASLFMAITACGHSNNSSGAPASARSRHRLEVVGEGVVLDPRTHLEWASRDQDESMTWSDADRR